MKTVEVSEECDDIDSARHRSSNAFLKKKKKFKKKGTKCQCSETIVKDLVDIIDKNDKYG